MNSLLSFTYALLLTAITLPCSAQWSTNGPYGGVINCGVTSSGGNSFVGTKNGIFISTNNGQSWAPANLGLERKQVGSLTWYNGKLYAGVYYNGVYVSSDDGATWTQKNNGLTNLYIAAIHASANGLFVTTSDGTFYSGDNGDNWMPANNGIPNTYLLYDYASVGDTIFGGSYGLGLYRTVDNGANWVQVFNGFPANTFVYALIADGNKIYAGTSVGVYKSSDKGISWTAANNGFPAGAWARSFAVKTGYVFAGTYADGIFGSTDGGNTWNPLNNGLPNLPIPNNLPSNYPTVDALVITGADVLAATTFGLYRSTNNGANWSEANQGILGTDVFAVSSNSSTLFAGTDRVGVYISNDNGNTWIRSNSGLTSLTILTLVTEGQKTFLGTQNEKVFRSLDNGGSWTPASSGLTSAVFILKTDSIDFYAATTGGQYVQAGIFKTINNGNSWTQLPTSFNGGKSSLFTRVGEIFVGTFDGKIFYSNDNGVTWQDKSTGLPPQKISVIYGSGNNLFAGTDGSGIYKSTDGGSNWNNASSGINNDTIKDILFVNGTLFAATWGGGVFQSTNMGVTWTGFSSGLMNLHVNGLTSSDGKLHAATDAGVYSTTLLTSIALQEDLANDIALYPNPSKGIVYFQAPRNQKAVFTINNVFGEEVFKFDGYPSDGASLDLSVYAKGIYFLFLQTKHGIVEKKIVIQ